MIIVMGCNGLIRPTIKHTKRVYAFIIYVFLFSDKNVAFTKMTSNQVNVSKPGKFIRSSLHKKYIATMGKRTS